MADGGGIGELLAVMARLRDPDKGCPWDVAQDFASIAPHTIEEAYEVADAIERGNIEDLLGELGDLLFQVVFHGRMAEEAGHFDFDEIARRIADKMVRRHPHVFGADDAIDSADAQVRNWETQKAQERTARAERDGRPESALDDVTLGLPALSRAEKLQKRAARVGFDFPDMTGVMDKVDEELGEVKAELVGGSHERQAAEIGDLLFAVTNLARFLKIDPEAALRGSNRRFQQRFQAIEAGLRAEGKQLQDATLAELDQRWSNAKQVLERTPKKSGLV